MNIYELAVVISATNRSADVINKVSRDLDGLHGKGAKMVDLGQKIAVNGALMQGAADKLTGSLEAVAQPAQDMQDALAKVSTVITPLENLEKSMGNVRKAGMAWQNQHRDTATKFIDTTYNMISAGLDEQAAIKGTETAMRVARATMGDAGQAAALVATVYNTMGNKTRDVGKEMGELGDIVTKTQQTFQFENLNQLNEGLKYGIPVALQNKVAFSELSAVMGFLNSNAIVGSQAGTSFGATMRSMQKASADLKFEIAKTKDGGTDFIGTVANIERKFGGLEQMTQANKDAFAEAFGSEGWAGLSLMIGKSAELASGLGKVKDNTDAAKIASDAMEATASAKLEIMSNRWNSLKVVIGEHLFPIIDKVGPKIGEVIDKLTGFAEANPTLVKTALMIMMVSAAILTVGSMALMYVGSMMMFGGHAMQAASMAGKAFVWMSTTALPALGSVIAASWAWVAALMANPITWIVLAVIAAAVLIYKYWGPISGFFTKLWDGITAIFTRAINAIKSVFADGFVAGMVKLIKLPGEVLRSAMTALVGVISAGFVALWVNVKATAIAAWQAIPGVINAVVSGFWTGVEAVKSGFFALVRAVPTFLRAIASGVLNGIASLIEGVAAVWDSLPGIIGGVVTILWTVLREWTPLGFFIDAFDSVTQWLFGFSLVDAGANIINSIASGMKSMASRPVEIMRGIAQKMRNLLPFSPAKDGPLRDIHKIRLIETIAGSIKAAPLTMAMQAAVAAAASVPAAPGVGFEVPMIAAPYQPTSFGAGPGGAPVELHQHLHVGSNVPTNDIEALRALLKDHGRELLKLLKEEERKDKRGDFS